MPSGRMFLYFRTVLVKRNEPVADVPEERETFQGGECTDVDVDPFLSHFNDFFHVICQLFVAAQMFPPGVRFSAEGLGEFLFHVFKSHLVALVVVLLHYIRKDFVLQLLFGFVCLKTKQKLLLQQNKFAVYVRLG